MAKATKNKEKHVTREDLKKAGIPIVSAREFGLHKLIKAKPKPVEEVQKMLSKVKISLSDEIIKMRQQP